MASQGALDTLDSFGNSATSIVTAAIVIPIAAAVVLKGILSKLWAMVNTLQLINTLSILSIHVPVNVMKV